MTEAVVLLSAVQATTQLVEQAFRILARLRKAHERQKNLVGVLARHENELSSVKAIIGIIDDEEDLHIPSVGGELARLQEVQTRLAKLLEALDPKSRGKLNQIAHQFVQGSTDEKNLSDIMNELAQVKAMLLLRIQVANVGVMRTMQKELVANTVVIQRIDDYLRQHISNCKGLRIARLLKDRRPSEDGTVPITEMDLRSLSKEGDESSEDETLVDDAEMSPRDLPIRTERIILRNIARNQSAQINAAIETDIWKDVNRLVIKDNVAEDQALQFNYGATLEITSLLLDRRDRLTTVPR